MQIGDKIKSLRKQARLSQEQLAEKLEVSRQTVSKWESGAALPERSNAVLMSRLFGVSLDELLLDELELSLEPISASTEEGVSGTDPEEEICVTKPQEETGRQSVVSMKQKETLRLCAIGAIVLSVAFLGLILLGVLSMTDAAYMSLAGMIAGFFTLSTVVYVAPFVALLYVLHQALKNDVPIREGAVSMIARFVVFVTIVVGLIHIPVAMSVAIAGSVYGYVAMVFALLAVSLGIFTRIRLKVEVKP